MRRNITLNLIAILSVFMFEIVLAETSPKSLEVLDKWELKYDKIVESEIITDQNGEYLAVINKEPLTNESGEIEIYDLNNRELLRTIHISKFIAHTVVFTVPSKQLIGFYDLTSKQIMFWNYDSGKKVFSIKTPRYDWELTPDENHLIIANRADRTFDVYTTKSGEKVGSLPFPTNLINDLCISGNGGDKSFTISNNLKWLYAACGKRGFLQKFNLTSGKLSRTYLVPARSITFNTDESKIFIPLSWLEKNSGKDGLVFLNESESSEMARTPTVNSNMSTKVVNVSLGGSCNSNSILAATHNGVALYNIHGENLGHIFLNIKIEPPHMSLSSGVSECSKKGFIAYTNRSVQIFYIKIK